MRALVVGPIARRSRLKPNAETRPLADRMVEGSGTVGRPQRFDDHTGTGLPIPRVQPNPRHRLGGVRPHGSRDIRVRIWWKNSNPDPFPAWKAVQNAGRAAEAP